MIFYLVAALALLAPSLLVLLDAITSQPAAPTPPPPVEAFETASGCPVVPGRPS